MKSHESDQSEQIQQLMEAESQEEDRALQLLMGDQKPE